MRTIIITYLITTPLIVILDFLWLGIVARPFYAKHLEGVINLNLNIPPAILFYLIYMVGIFIFAIYPGVISHSLVKTIAMSALFGFMCYMTYDLTNLASIKNFPIKVALLDILWGTVAGGLAGAVAYQIYFWLK